MTKITDLASIEAVSGVSTDTGDPFVQLRASSTDGSIVLLGQLDPDACWGLARAIGEAASTSCSDAALHGLMLSRLHGAGDDEAQNRAGVILRDLREYRAAMEIHDEVSP